MTAAQDHMMDSAADALLLNGKQWDKLVSTWTVPGSTFAHAIVQTDPYRFAKYHDDLEFLVDGKDGKRTPSVRLTGLHDPSDDKAMLDAMCRIQSVRSHTKPKSCWMSWRGSLGVAHLAVRTSKGRVCFWDANVASHAMCLLICLAQKHAGINRLEKA